jgi:hypothetical protein
LSFIKIRGTVSTFKNFITDERLKPFVVITDKKRKVPPYQMYVVHSNWLMLKEGLVACPMINKNAEITDMVTKSLLSQQATVGVSQFPITPESKERPIPIKWENFQLRALLKHFGKSCYSVRLIFNFKNHLPFSHYFFILDVDELEQAYKYINESSEWDNASLASSLDERRRTRGVNKRFYEDVDHSAGARVKKVAQGKTVTG